MSVTGKSSLAEEQIEHRSCFMDLPDEIILTICHYLTPTEALIAFIECNIRLFSCLSDYHKKVDLTKASWGVFSNYLEGLKTKWMRPLMLKLSNARIIQQIDVFFHQIDSSLYTDFGCVRHLSLLEFPSTNFICYNEFPKLIDLSLVTNKGLILSKLVPNQNLKYLTLRLENVNDLYVLLDGLVPNLVDLNVSLHESHMMKRFGLPKSWPRQSMFELKRLQLRTHRNVEFTFDELSHIVIPLINLNSLIIYIENWVSRNEQFTLQFEQFFCSICTINHIDMTTFSKFNERWLVKCRFDANNSNRHFYTVPWSFDQLKFSMLADDDVNSICQNVKNLTLDTSSTSAHLSRRYPNLYTLNIPSECQLFHDDHLGLRHLRQVTMKDINVLPSSIIKRIYTTHLISLSGLSTNSNVYPNMRNLSVNRDIAYPLETVHSIIQHFPNLRSLTISLKLREPEYAEYYDCLNILLDGVHLPCLLFLKTNRIKNYDYNSWAKPWILSNISMKWRSSSFDAFNINDNLIVNL